MGTYNRINSLWEKKAGISHLQTGIVKTGRRDVYQTDNHEMKWHSALIWVVTYFLMN